MPLPYENSSSGERALGEIQKLLRGFGCTKFGSMSDDEAKEILVQFEYRGRMVNVKASIRGYAAAWLKEHPYTHLKKGRLDRTAKRGSVRRGSPLRRTTQSAVSHRYSSSPPIGCEC
jgi:hypothetical protein